MLCKLKPVILPEICTACPNSTVRDVNDSPESKVHGANMGPIWGRQDPVGPHVGFMNFAIWEVSDIFDSVLSVKYTSISVELNSNKGVVISCVIYHTLNGNM